MYGSDISTAYTNGSAHLQADAFAEAAQTKDSAGKKAEQASAPPAGDTATISPEARNAAAQAKDSAAPLPPSQDTAPAKEVPYSPVKTVTTSDGTTVNIEASYAKDKNGYKQVTSVRVNFSGTDGETYSHTLSESSILTKDENGKWQVSQVQGKTVSGTDSDDIIVLLPTGKPIAGVTDNGVVLAKFYEDKTTMTVDAGEGDNVVMDFSGEITSITTGSGKDTIVGSSHTGRYVVNSGGGDDDITLQGSEAYVYSGEGNDTVNFKDILLTNVDTGAGNDRVYIAGISAVNDRGGKLNTGAGDDSIVFEHNASGVVLSGDGNDTVTYNSSGGTAYIDLGNGNDVVKGKGSGGTHIIVGNDGDDYIKTEQSGGKEYIYGGNGNDTINLGSGGGGTHYVYGGNGDDHIQFSRTGGETYIDGGSGNDTIYAEVNGGRHYITGGDGDDLIYARSSAAVSDFATITGGKGNDTILVDNYESTASKEELSKILENIKARNQALRQSMQTEMSEYDKQIADAALGIRSKRPTHKAITSKHYSAQTLSSMRTYNAKTPLLLIAGTGENIP